MEKDITNRINYLAEVFDIFDVESEELINEKLNILKNDGYDCKIIKTSNDIVLAIYSTKLNNRERLNKKVSLSSDVFAKMVLSDPTENKIYSQWIGNLFVQLIKENTSESNILAIRLVVEDLPQTNKFLTLFEGNKRKKKFLDLCKVSYILKNVKDPTNINQYKSLSQLFDAVDPFIERNISSIERTMLKYVESGQAIIPCKDRFYTVYIPKTLGASTLFEGFTNWCTSLSGNGMFDTYTQKKQPNGENYNLYIVIDNEFFYGRSKNLYQLHFETNQIKDRRNGENIDFYSEVLKKSDALSSFFYDELINKAKEYQFGLDSNLYLDALINFGFAECLFEIMEETTPNIKFTKRKIAKLPDISNFKELDELIIINADLTNIHPSVGSLQKLRILSLTNNKITSIPHEIGYLKNLLLLNLNGNPIEEIPSSIKYLDSSNGGSLLLLGIDRNEIGEEKYKKLQEMLPNTKFGNI